jgi:hypothetical protein
MSNDAEKVSSRSAVILVIVVILVAGYAIEFGLQTLVWGETRHWASANPWLLDVPQPLPGPSTPPPAPAKTDVLKSNGFQFQAPWPGKVETRDRATGTAFRFESGQAIFFFDPATQVDTLRQMESATREQYLTILSIFGPKPFDSNYSLYAAVYGASPAQTSPFQDRGESLRLNQLILMKLSFGVEAAGPIYTFQFGSNRGLQFGDPAKGLPVVLHVFDDRDQQYRVIISSAAGSNASVTQGDVEIVAASLRHIPIIVH